MRLSLIHIDEPTRRRPTSYAVVCVKKKKSVGTTAAGGDHDRAARNDRGAMDDGLATVLQRVGGPVDNLVLALDTERGD